MRERNCRDCFYCKVKKGIIRCKQGMWADKDGNDKTLKTESGTFFSSYSRVLVRWSTRSRGWVVMKNARISHDR